MIADLPQNREIGASWLVSFVFQCLLSGRFTKYLPALSSFSYGMPVIFDSLDLRIGLILLAKEWSMLILGKNGMTSLNYLGRGKTSNCKKRWVYLGSNAPGTMPNNLRFN